MKLQIEPTTKIIQVEGVECRRWIGKDEHGVDVEVLVRCLSPQTHCPDVLERYDRELRALAEATCQPVVFDMRFLD